MLASRGRRDRRRPGSRRPRFSPAKGRAQPARAPASKGSWNIRSPFAPAGATPVIARETNRTAAAAKRLTRRATSRSLKSFGSELAPDHRSEQGSSRDAREFQPGLERGDRAGAVLRASADLDLAPAGFPTQIEEDAVAEEFRPARAVERILQAHDEADDFRTAKSADEAQERDRPVAQVSEIARGQGVEHGHDMLQ